jgi:ubiquinone/menaquinone biosynthesis C-methylase UbiE
MRLNLGCGKDIRKNWINLDHIKLPGVDVVHNINDIPLPFENDLFDEILCASILEHVDYIPLLRDLHRILKPGGKIAIIVPHFTSKYAFADPTHVRCFSTETLLFFTENYPMSYYFDFHFSKAEKIHICFNRSRAGYFYNHLLEPLVNMNSRIQDFYEGSFLRIFPATNMEVVLVK